MKEPTINQVPIQNEPTEEKKVAMTRIDEINERQAELAEIVKAGSKGREEALRENKELEEELIARNAEILKEKRGEEIVKQATIKNELEAKIEGVKKRQAELSILLGESKNILAKEEYDELNKESLSLNKQIDEIKNKFPDMEQFIKNKEDVEKIKITLTEENLIKNENENQIKLEESRTQYIKAYEKSKKELERIALIDKTRTTTYNILAGIKNVFSKNKMEYKKSPRPENHNSEEMVNAKKEYTQARIEMGESMYKKRKYELEKAGLSKEETEKALIEYKATEILYKTIIEEHKKIIASKEGEVVIKTALWRKLLNVYMSIKPRWKRVALSTLLFLPLSATGAIGASAIAGFGTIGLAGFATVKFGASMLIGAGVAQGAKGIDLIMRKKDIQFTEIQNNKGIELRNKFGKGEITLDDYEKGMTELEEKDKSRRQNRMLLKAGVGGALAIASGFVAYDAMGHGIENLRASSVVDSVGEPNISEVENVIKEIKHVKVEAIVDNNQGGISLAHEFKENLKIGYGNDLQNAPANVKHALSISDEELAKEIGVYKPGETEESARLFKGDKIISDENGSFKFDRIKTDKDVILQKATEIKPSAQYDGQMFDSDHSGLKIKTGDNIIDDKYKIPAQSDPTTIEKPTLEVENNLTPDEIEELNETHLENLNRIFPNLKDWENIKNVTPAGKLFTMEEVADQYKPLVSYVKNLKEITGLDPTPNETIPAYIKRALQEAQENGDLDKVVYPKSVIIEQVNQEVIPTQVDPEVIKNFEFDNSNHVISIKENGASLTMQFSYDENGKILDVEVGGDMIRTTPNPYPNESILNKLDLNKKIDANIDIFKMSLKAEFLDKLPHDTYEYKFLHDEVVEMQKNIISSYGNVINPDKIESTYSYVDITNQTDPEVVSTVKPSVEENTFLKPKEVGTENISPKEQISTEKESILSNPSIERPLKTITLNENINGIEGSLKMEFKYDAEGNIIGHNIGGASSQYSTENNPYIDANKWQKIRSNPNFESYKIHKAQMETNNLYMNRSFLNKLPPDSPEYKYLYNQALRDQKFILKNYGDIIKHDSLLDNNIDKISQEVILNKESILSQFGAKSVEIEKLKDLKEIIKGYEWTPGQILPKMIMDKISGEGYHAIITEDLGGTETGAKFASISKVNLLTSSMKIDDANHLDYRFYKTLPNGNVKALNIHFYKE
jgi:hypothetical protein